MGICDKTQLKAQSLQRKALYKNNARKNKSNPNYYPSIASADSSSIESTCIFLEILNKMHYCMCGIIQVNKINSWFQPTHNKDIYQWITHKYKSVSS